MKQVALVVLAGCIVAPPPPGPRPMAPPPQQPIAAPPPAPPDPRITSCQEPMKLRERAFCLSKIEDERAIDALLAVARQTLTARPEQSISPREDFEYAAENAGIVAAKTSVAGLDAHVATGDTTAQRFGLRGLGHALSLLRMGYAHGGDRDRTKRAEIVRPVGDRCRERLASPEELVVSEAYRCLGETRDARHAVDLVQAIVARSDRSALARTGVTALRELDKLDVTAVRPLVRLIENPMPARTTSDDVWIRADVCRLLASVVGPSDTWAQLAAKTAAERIGKSNSQAREACERLAAKTGGAAVAAPTSGKNWFPAMRLESCRPDRFGIVGDVQVCVFSEPAGPTSRTYSLRVEDPSRLDPNDNTRHAAILSTALTVRALEYLQPEMVASYELSGGFWLIVVPIVEGTPDRYRGKYAQLHLFDSATKKLSLVHTTTACRGDSCRQDVQLSRKKGIDTPVDVLVEGDARQRVVWDGRALRPAR